MSDDFIPLNQSTPVSGRWQGQRNQRNNNQNQSWHQNGQRRGNNKWRNNSQSFNRNNSYGSDTCSSFSQEKASIDAYLHPSMLQDPWAQLRKKLEDSNSK